MVIKTTCHSYIVLFVKAFNPTFHQIMSTYVTNLWVGLVLATRDEIEFDGIGSVFPATAPEQSVCQNTRQSVLISALLEHDNRIQTEQEIVVFGRRPIYQQFLFVIRACLAVRFLFLRCE